MATKIGVNQTTLHFINRIPQGVIAQALLSSPLIKHLV
jgi:hypothetical protein